MSNDFDFLGSSNFPPMHVLSGASTPPKPSEDGVFRATKRSRSRDDGGSSGYRDRLMNGTPQVASVESIAKETKIEVSAGDISIDRSGRYPMVTMSTALKDKLVKNMSNSVVVNLLGGRIGFTALCDRIRSLWKVTNAKVVDMGEGYYLVQFQKHSDYSHALINGPWTMLGSYLQVQAWTPSFRTYQDTPRTTTVWVRISDLPLHLYPEEVMKAVGEAIGDVIRVDYNTTSLQRGRFARLAVVVDLFKPLVSMFSLDGEDFKVEYENLTELCIHCGMFGHLTASCTHVEEGTTKPATDSTMEVETRKPLYGEWMIVEKKRRPTRQSGKEGSKENVDPNQASRFAVLGESNQEVTNSRASNSKETRTPSMSQQPRVLQESSTVNRNKGKKNGSKGTSRKGK